MTSRLLSGALLATLLVPAGAAPALAGPAPVAPTSGREAAARTTLTVDAPGCEELLRTCCDAPAWAARVAAARPFGSVDALLAVAAAELAATSEEAVDVALAARNRRYEERFGHVYLVFASGRSATELLDLLEARLGNDPATERQVLRRELAAITDLRLRRLLGQSA